MLEKLEAAGVEFGRTPDGRYHRTQGFGQPGTWWVHIANGMTIKRAMARIVRDAGINTLDNVMAVKILTGEADVSEMPIEYAPQFTKKYNEAMCAALGLTPPDGYEAIAAE